MVGSEFQSSEILSCNEEDPIKNEGTRVFTSPIITLWERSVAMETRFRFDLTQNLMQPFSDPNDVSGKT